MDVVNYQKCDTGEDDAVVIVALDQNSDCLMDEDEINQMAEEENKIESKRVEFDENHEVVLETEEVKKWKRIFSKLDEVDTTRKGVVSINELKKIIARLEDRKSYFYLGRQTQRKAKMLEKL